MRNLSRVFLFAAVAVSTASAAFPKGSWMLDRAILERFVQKKIKNFDCKYGRSGTWAECRAAWNDTEKNPHEAKRGVVILNARLTTGGWHLSYSDLLDLSF
jgi:hypothetical protein